MIAVDTNILVYAHRAESPFHRAAATAIAGLVAGQAPWVVPWHCLQEFLAIVTHPRRYDPPTPVALAAEAIARWLEVPNLTVLTETDQHWHWLKRLVTDGKTGGGQLYDAAIAALCLEHGVSELWSADRDFGRFPQLKVVNPLIAR